MIPAQAATQKMRRPRDLEVVQRVRGSLLADEERDERGQCDRGQSEHERSFVRNRREVDGEDERADENHREDAPEVVHGVARLVHMTRHEEERHDQSDARERQRDEEDRSPPELLEQRTGDKRPEGSDSAAERRPERDRLRATRTGPERRDERERRRIGHPGRRATSDASHEQHLVGRRVRSEQRHRDRERGAEDEHHLAPIAVAERTEVEHRGREPERVADRDQVERDLRRVEGLTDRRQRDVRDRQVQVRDRSDEDQRDEDDAGTVRCFGAGFGSQVGAAHVRDSIRWTTEPLCA